MLKSKLKCESSQKSTTNDQMKSCKYHNRKAVLKEGTHLRTKCNKAWPHEQPGVGECI